MQTKSTDLSAHPYLLLPGEGGGEYRERITREQAERAAQRRGELAQQTNAMATPYERICLWERLHELRLPQADAHPLLHVIAQQTGLSVGQVVHEQKRRQLFVTRPL